MNRVHQGLVASVLSSALFTGCNRAGTEEIKPDILNPETVMLHADALWNAKLIVTGDIKFVSCEPAYDPDLFGGYGQLLRFHITNGESTRPLLCNILLYEDAVVQKAKDGGFNGAGSVEGVLSINSSGDAVIVVEKLADLRLNSIQG